KRMMYLGVKDLDDDGRVVAEHRIVGLLAQRAFSTPASTVPLLRRKLQQILAAEDVVEHSHDERAIRTLFESMPKQDLFEASTDDLRRTISHLLETTRSGDVRVVFRTGPVSPYLPAEL